MFREHIVTFSHFLRSSTIMHQYFARIDINEDMDKHFVFGEHLMRYEVLYAAFQY